MFRIPMDAFRAPVRTADPAFYKSGLISYTHLVKMGFDARIDG